MKNSFITKFVKGSILNSAKRLEKIAQATGWQNRKPKKLKAIDFVHGLLAAVTRGDCSFRLMACSIGEHLDEKSGGGFDTISKPALWERVGPEAVWFLKSVLAEMIKDCVQPRRYKLPALPTITRIIVEDSTILNFDKQLVDIYPAGTNEHGTSAGARLQAAFDLITGDPLLLDLTSYKRNDQSATGNIIPLLCPGDLILRDLGYFAYKSFIAIVGQGADYLSRYLGNCVLHHVGEDETEGERIDLLQYLQEHAPLTGDIVDLDVLVGSGQKGIPRFASRLVARRVPKAIEEKRLRRLGKAEKQQGNTYSKAHRRLLGWEIYITSLSAEDVSAEKILELYPLRWRIEIIFKACKSHTGLRAIAAHRSNVYHVKAMLYAWVCALVVATATKVFALAFANSAGELRPNCLSLLKVVAKAFTLLRDMISVSCAPPTEIIGRCLCQMEYHDCYESRKKRTNMAAMLGSALELPDLKLSGASAIKATKLRS